MINLKITGTQINCYFVCHRKLWLFSRGIQLEQKSDVVFQGKLVGEQSYDRRRKEIAIGDTIVIDGFDASKGVIYEVKKSRAVEKAHIWQTKYYLYTLKTLGIMATAEIDYPLLRRTEKLKLIDEDEIEIKKISSDIQMILESSKAPELRNKSFCRKCAYFEFCWE